MQYLKHLFSYEGLGWIDIDLGHVDYSRCLFDSYVCHHDYNLGCEEFVSIFQNTVLFTDQTIIDELAIKNCESQEALHIITEYDVNQSTTI